MEILFIQTIWVKGLLEPELHTQELFVEISPSQTYFENLLKPNGPLNFFTTIKVARICFLT